MYECRIEYIDCRRSALSMAISICIACIFNLFKSIESWLHIALIRTKMWNDHTAQPMRTNKAYPTTWVAYPIREKRKNTRAACNWNNWTLDECLMRSTSFIEMVKIFHWTDAPLFGHKKKTTTTTSIRMIRLECSDTKMWFFL